MNYETHSTEPKVVTDTWGNVDVAYYEAQAMRMRNEYFQASMSRLGKRVKDITQDWFRKPAQTRDA